MRIRPLIWLAACMLLTTLVYIPGLNGGFILDDYPNIVDNPSVQPVNANLPKLIRAALSSPASDLKRPLASLSFAANYLVSGLDPFEMKLTNLVIHLLNGLMVFLLARCILYSVADDSSKGLPCAYLDTTSVLIAGAWLLLPINLTGVLYVVQRMESLANFFVLLGLCGYILGRRRMLETSTKRSWRSFVFCTVSLLIPTCVGLGVKETAIMLPLYACVIEWAIFRFRAPVLQIGSGTNSTVPAQIYDKRIVVLFVVVLWVPMLIGVAWLLPHVTTPAAWANRNFNLATRLLSESRVIVDYVVWTLLPTPHALSFYHDNFPISTGLLAPWTTLVCIALIIGVIALLPWLRSKKPLAALGIALFLSCQLLTSTIIPLELVYEHRNYFASFGLLLAIVPLLVLRRSGDTKHILVRRALFAALMILWTSLTAITAYAWGEPLRLAQALAIRAPTSPRAQYELGRTYIIYSKYQPDSPYTQQAYPALENAAAMPESSILPQQALIFMNARMHLPIKQAWWDSMIDKLRTRVPGVQDESSLGSLVQCARDHECDLPKESMTQAFQAAISHPNPTARVLAMYGDYAWNVLGNRDLGEQMIRRAVQIQPNEAAYRITLTRMYMAKGERSQAAQMIDVLKRLNIGGSLDGDISRLQEAMK